jgi:hypothetical protein
MVCFVVGLGLAGGAINYANEEEKTLAGDPSEFELVAGCPPGYTPVQVPKETPSKVDLNGDHIICTDGAGDFVDNTYVPNDDDVRLMANGHGNFIDNAKFVELSKVLEIPKVQDISFSFTGIERGAEGSAKGQFEYHDQTGDGQDLAVHGDVLCLAVDPLSLTATFIGQVTRSNDKKLLVGSTVGWQAQDNSEGDFTFTPDLVTRLYSVPGAACKQKFKVAVPTMRAIVSGNIQVHY